MDTNYVNAAEVSTNERMASNEMPAEDVDPITLTVK
jgi:hypothetical protein